MNAVTSHSHQPVTSLRTQQYVRVSQVRALQVFDFKQPVCMRSEGMAPMGYVHVATRVVLFCGGLRTACCLLVMPSAVLPEQVKIDSAESGRGARAGRTCFRVVFHRKNVVASRRRLPARLPLPDAHARNTIPLQHEQRTRNHD